jgi:hypothetical protein
MLAAELADLDEAGFDLPLRIQSRWRRHESPRKMPRERGEPERGSSRGRRRPH